MAIDSRTDEVIDLQTLFARLWSGRRWIFISTVIFLTGFLVTALVMQPVYRAQTILSPASKERGGLSSLAGTALGSLGGLASLAGVNLESGGSLTDEALAVLKSRQFSESFLLRHGLIQDLYAEQWNKSTGRWIGAPPSLAKAVRRLNEIRAATVDKNSGLVTLQIDYSDPTKAADWANYLVTELNTVMRARAITQTDAAIAYLKSELKTTDAIDTKASINRLIEAQMNQRMIANISPEFAFRVIDKAMPPESGDAIRPRRVLLVSLGAALGFSLGIAAVLFFRSDS